MTTSLDVCILAAGVGSRMRSNKPKVLQTIAGRPLLAHLLDRVAELDPSAVHVVIGQGADDVKSAFQDRRDVNWVYQAERLGTGHAMQQVVPQLSSDRTLILLGDAPLIQLQTLETLSDVNADLSVLTVDMADPFNYGRIVRDGEQVVRIVEEKDANESEKKIKEINTGVMSADTESLKNWLGRLDNNNAQQEYLLTDIVEHGNTDRAKVTAIKVDDPIEVTGINTFGQLAALERALQMKTAEELMAEGVQIMDPARLDIRGNLTAGQGVKIDVNVVFEGNVTLADHVQIGPNCVITDSTIGAGSVIKANSVLEEATVGDQCNVGPFARLRPGANLTTEVSVGNFVEVKKTTMGRGSKASHLTYLGDTTVGEEVNIGAGTITCNYDGVNKFETQIGDGAFIGSNSALVAPVSIGAGSTVGAGSTITKDVEAEVLVVSRGKQIAIANWQRPTQQEKKD
ncbi:MAG: bifunctional UDP-N-acetylglucosamine diphosphorylase/glucosamine-1-phosphate N-acetyltransferase GlmU [Pseudomonadales bacterium]|nr:bifunctional UDP-N-acetylglucosamine diphosphorylase/glucosamine-1-phosphate N-acetyltransferase GlmU [Pseudomonadales bacterium]MBO6564429.1 bifunctional UDP-N-acetylglucosamine diphosphorylase/glucosamine-1-phosphate N-acetyltransferase GlmU [Pseudomonadales bacterium]MBO6596650.1 bifunctional UDP-N-acetylglucosamine diphosphorylase/glucosamine-1-phosphate N-acetyltransferase GlmU [Pseudomonadales bacterium]MBO6656515.1 bifunctional UDP-N-acetylglucosamine diphosphorylase/glucosamine-1-phos